MLSTIIEAAAFAFHRHFTSMNKEGKRWFASRTHDLTFSPWSRGCVRAGEEASKVISKLRDGMKGAIDFQSDMPNWKKFAEVFCVQNAFGTPCTSECAHLLAAYKCSTPSDCARWVCECRCSRHWDNDLLCMRDGLSFGGFCWRDDVVICHDRNGQAGCLDRCPPYHRDSPEERRLWCIGRYNMRYVFYNEVRNSRTAA